MTKFCADAVGVRSGRPKGYTKKDLRKNMEKFIQTGVHPDVQKAQQKAAADAVTPLPDHDPNRDFVFLDLQLGGQPLGKLVIELFSDVLPVAANHLRQRCLPGSKTGLAGAQVHKLQPGLALWLGKNPAASEGMRLQPNPRLRHADAGAVSISLSGDEVAVTLGRALILDKTYQVVGRVHGGEDVLDKLNDVPVSHTDAPLQKLVVFKCGPTNASGSYEELQGAGAGGDGSKDPMARLAKQSQDARHAVKQALAVGLGQKRLPEVGKDAAEGSAAGRRVKAKLLDTMLDDLSDDSDSDSDAEGDAAAGDSNAQDEQTAEDDQQAAVAPSDAGKAQDAGQAQEQGKAVTG